MLTLRFSPGSLILAAWLSFSCPVSGQQLTVGFVGGVGLTNDFPLTEYSTPADTYGNPASWFQFKTGPKSFIAGASVEVRLWDSFSIEANVLRRPMTAVLSSKVFPVGQPAISSSMTETEVKAWEFPVMLKHSFGPARWAGGARPFIEAGPSFRTQEDSAVQPSRFGLTAGVGVAWRLGPVGFGPTLRYTRWDPEHIAPKFVTKADQIEVLATVAYHTDAESWRVAGHRPVLGALAGISAPSFAAADGGVQRIAVMAGVTAGVPLNDRLSVEADGIYKPLRSSFGGAGHYSVITWDFPVLAKYQWTKSPWTPFIEAGPSFRLAGNLNNPSHYGVTAVAGMERRVGSLRITPTLRYTRWAVDPPLYYSYSGGNERTSANVVEVLFGISF